MADVPWNYEHTDQSSISHCKIQYMRKKINYILVKSYIDRIIKANNQLNLIKFGNCDVLWAYLKKRLLSNCTSAYGFNSLANAFANLYDQCYIRISHQWYVWFSKHDINEVMPDFHLRLIFHKTQEWWWAFQRCFKFNTIWIKLSEIHSPP